MFGRLTRGVGVIATTQLVLAAIAVGAVATYFLVKWYLRRRRRNRAVLETAHMLRRFGVLLEAGMLPQKALALLTAHTRNPETYRKLSAVLALVEQGKPIADSMESHIHVLGRATVTALRAAERSGDLPETVSRLAEIHEQKYLIRREISISIRYPLLVLLFSFFVGWMTLVYAVPVIKDIGSQFSTSVPAIPLSIIGGFLKYSWLQILIVLIPIFVIARSGVTARLLRFIPGLRRLRRDYLVQEYAYPMATLLGAGMLPQDCLATMAEINVRSELRKPLERAWQEVEGGGSFHQALRYLWFFRTTDRDLIGIAEGAEALRVAIHTLAERATGRFHIVLRSLVRLVYPALFLLTGCFVAIIVNSYFCSLYTVYRGFAARVCFLP